MAAGLVMRCTVTDLEAGFSATGKAHYRLASRQRALWPLVVISQSVLDRAYEVQGLLAERSQHRVVKIPDLMIAAAAEASGLVVLHYDRDFDRIARITGQPTRWVVKAGTADGE